MKKSYQVKKVQKSGDARVVVSMMCEWSDILDVMYRVRDTYKKVSSTGRDDRYFWDEVIA